MLRDIDKSILKKRIMVEEAERSQMVYNEALGNEGVPFGFRHSAWVKFKARILDGDELWEFDGSRKSWLRRFRSKGILLVRNEEVVATFVTAIS